MTEERCKGCGRKVIFIVDDKGKTQILDAVAPTWRISDDCAGTRYCHRAAAYVSHFSICPKASEFSKKRKGGSYEQ